MVNKSNGFSEYDTRRQARNQLGNFTKQDKNSRLIQTALHNSKGYKQAIMIVSSFGKSSSGSMSYVDYISQEDNVPLFDKNNKIIEKDHALNKIQDWVDDTKERKGVTRYTMHFVLQSEPSANEEKAKKGMQEFLKKAFPKNDYIYAFHTDKESPHMHVSVKMQDQENKKIQAIKSDLRKWREDYAESMRAQGFDYASTSRSSRGKTGKSLSGGSKIKFGYYDKQINESNERPHDKENIEKWNDLYNKIGSIFLSSKDKTIKQAGKGILNMSQQREK